MIRFIESIKSSRSAGLKALAERFGYEKLWHAGLKVLKFPATWCVSLEELMRVQEELEQAS